MGVGEILRCDCKWFLREGERTGEEMSLKGNGRKEEQE